MSFDPSSVRAFRCLGYGFDEATATARLRYAFDDGPEMVEELRFPGAELPLTEARRAALARCLRDLHLVAGVSYYKAAVPPEIRVETGPLPVATAGFLDRLYLRGLGEFAYRNRLDLADRVRFPASPAAVPDPSPLELPRRTAVPVGGGKDSVVTIEALRAAGEPMVLISVGDYEPIRAVARVAGVPRIVIERRLAPELFELNRQGALNGHVPISAILAFVLAAAAVLYGFDAVAMSNERSADSGNLRWNELEVNHQYSKSRAFEEDFGEHLRHRLLPGLRYFSFLRPLSELAIAAVFSRHTRYHRDFRSCNRAFHLHAGDRRRGWCRACPKCRFVFLALAPFLGKPELLEIFGADLLDDPAQEPGYAELLGLAEHKPFECVGEIDECRAALALLADAPSWREDLLVRRLGERALPAEVAARRRMIDAALAPAGVEGLPERYRGMLPSVPGV